MWRSAKTEDSERIVEMCRNLNIEDPSEDSRSGEMFVRRTLVELSANPVRGQAVVLEYDGMVCGYALLISYWSNELGGEVCSIDELFVEPSLRGKGFATQLITRLQSPQNNLWPARVVAVTVETHRTNTRTRDFYERLGFSLNPNHHMKFVMSER